MKILHILPIFLPGEFGTVTRINKLLRPLVPSGEFEFHILVPRRDLMGKEIYSSPVLDREIIDGMTVHRVDAFGQIPSAVKKICTEVGIHVLHLHGPRFAFYAFRSGVRLPTVIEVHSIMPLNLPKYLSAKWCYRRAQHFVVLSEKAKEKLSVIYGIDKGKVHVIYNGIDILETKTTPSGKAVRAKHGLDSRFVIGYTGSFYDWQGVSILVKAVTETIQIEPDVRFLMVGDGPLLEFCRRQVKKLGIEEFVRLPGSVRREEIPDYLAAMDVVTIPRPSTLATETTVPLKLLEAMNAGKPVLATRVGGIEEIIRHGESGFLVEPGNPHALADGIIELIKNPELREHLSKRGKIRTQNHPTWEQSAHALAEIYRYL